MSAVRVLGFCGLVASALAAAGGFMNMPALLGASGAVMFAGNVYAAIRGNE